MTTVLDKIQARFNRASYGYDTQASAQKHCAWLLIKQLLSKPNFLPHNVLDAGCGTGFITETLLPKLPNCTFHLNDLSEEMLTVCKEKFINQSNIAYIPGDMMAVAPQNYECVISNFALQWLDDLQAGIMHLHSQSSNFFAFSTLLDGTFAQWHRLIKNHQTIEWFNYPQKTNLAQFCRNIRRPNQNFEYWYLDIPLKFANPRDFMHHIRAIGASATKTPLNQACVKQLLASNKCLTATYKVFFGIYWPQQFAGK